MTTRITGLYSGLDVDALVEAGASYYQNKVNTAKQSEQKLEWQQEQYRTIQSSVQTFYDKYLSSTGEDSLMLSSNWNTKTFTSSNSSAVSATGSTDAVLDTYKVSATQLASAATTGTALSDQSTYSHGITVTVGSNAYSLSQSEISACSDESAIAAALNTKLSSSGVTAKYSSISGGLVIASNNMGSSAAFSVTATNSSGASSTTSYKGNNLHATITNSAGTVYTMDDSTNTTAANTATVDGITFNFSDVTSSSSSKYLTSSSINDLLGDYVTKIDTSTSGQTTYTLTNGSKLTMKNTGEVSAVDSSNNSINSISLTNGPSITLDGSNKTATVTSTDDNSVTLTGTSDVSDVQDKIESFMDDYNTLMKTINGKVYETYDKSYQPLTDSEKSSMTDSQITKWETKAQTGLLRHDSYLEKLADDMKSAMSSFFQNSGIDIESIGIKAVDDYTTKNGTYTVDSSKLKSALEGNITKTSGGTTKTISFDDIKNLFTNGYSSITSLSTKNSDSDGILSKLKVALNNNATMSSSELAKRAGIEGTTSETTNEITQLLKDQNTLIDDLEEKLSDKEDALYSKYSKLETSLSSLESSSSIFSS